MPRIIIVCRATLAIILAIVVASLLASDQARGQATVNVDVGDFYFCNASFERGVCETNITAGDTVTWVWVGASPHTVTQCDTGFINCPPTGGFDSNIRNNGATFSQTFTTAGTFEYWCRLHSTEMRGRVNVAAAQSTPTPGAGQTTAAVPTTAAGPTAADAQTATIQSGASGTRQSSEVASMPDTGGAPSDGGSSWPLIPVLAGGIFVISLAGAGIAVQRRR